MRGFEDEDEEEERETSRSPLGDGGGVYKVCVADKPLLSKPLLSTLLSAFIVGPLHSASHSSPTTHLLVLTSVQY